MKLNELHIKIRKYLYLEDTKTVDLILAIMISRLQEQAKLWLVLIGRSGDGKTELLKMLDDKGETTYIVKNMTENTLVNGKRGREKEDLAPQLKNKVLMIPEMAQILSLNVEAKRKVFAQLRDLYDGEAGKISAETNKPIYKDLNVSFIGCSTPTIDKQIIIHNDLGTRELLYRTKDKDEVKLMTRIITNTLINKNKIREELRRNVIDFIDSKEYKSIEIKKEVLEDIKKWALITAKLRAPADIDRSSGELTNPIYPEQPTRVLQQLLTFYRALKSLDEEYSDERALEIIKELATSSGNQIRIKVLMKLLEEKEEHTKRQLANKMDIDYRTVYGQLNALTNMGLVKRRDIVMQGYDERYMRLFKVNKEDITVQHLAKVYLKGGDSNEV
jgi:DNA-binding transcriptional ArsR family regulator